MWIYRSVSDDARGLHGRENGQFARLSLQQSAIPNMAPPGEVFHHILLALLLYCRMVTFVLIIATRLVEFDFFRSGQQPRVLGRPGK